MTTLLYLHGFNSAFDASSSKVRQFGCLHEVSRVLGITFRFHDDDVMPRLDDLMQGLLAQGASVVAVGPSLRGSFARHLALRFTVPRITINPSMGPWLTLRRTVGVEQQNFKTGERSIVTEGWLQDLKSPAVQHPSGPALAVLSQDDEMLDFDDSTIARLRSEGQVVLTTGGHRLEVLPEPVRQAVGTFLQTAVRV